MYVQIELCFTAGHSALLTFVYRNRLWTDRHLWRGVINPQCNTPNRIARRVKIVLLLNHAPLVASVSENATPQPPSYLALLTSR